MSKADMRQIAINAAAYREMLRRREGRAERPVKTLRCRVVGVQGEYRAPNLMDRTLSFDERLGDLEPMAFDLILRGTLTANDRDTMRALAELSRTGGSVTVRVEVGE